MAADELPDLDELSIELVRLERRQPELARQLERAEEQAILERIDELDALLLPLRRVPDR